MNRLVTRSRILFGAIVAALLLQGVRISSATPKIGTYRILTFPLMNTSTTEALENVRIVISDQPAWLKVLEISRLGPTRISPGTEFVFEIDSEIGPEFASETAKVNIGIEMWTDTPVPNTLFLTWRITSDDGFVTSAGLCVFGNGDPCGEFQSPDVSPPFTEMHFGGPVVADGPEMPIIGPETNISFTAIDQIVPDAVPSGVSSIGYAVNALSAGVSEFKSYDETQLLLGRGTMAEAGIHAISFASRDESGNDEPVKSVTVVYDNQPPAAPNNLVLEGPTWRNTSLYTITWDNPADVAGIRGSLVSLSYYPDNFYSLSESLTLDLTDRLANGNNLLRVWLEDGVYNVSSDNFGSVMLRHDDITPRSSASAPRFLAASPITVSFVSTDEGADQPSPTASGVAWTKLWYRRVSRDADCSAAQGPWTETALPPVLGGEGVASSLGTFPFDPQGVEGNYCFYTQVADVASNTTPPPVSTTVVAAQTLYDPSAPAISGLRLVAVGSRSGTLEWTTDDLTGGLVEYGPTTAFGSSVQTAMGKSHSAIMDGALPSPARIYYRVTATNQVGLSLQSAVESFVTTMDLDYPVDDFGVLDMTQPIQLEISNRELNSLSVSLGDGQTVGTSLIVPAGVELVKITMNGITINALFQPDRLVQAGENPYAVSGGGVISSVSPGSSIVEWTAGEAVVGDLAAEKGKAALGYYARIDPVKPGDIAGFTAAPGPEQGQLTLAWTAVGDDADKGTAMSYDLRIAPEPLTQVNFLKAVRVRESPRPSASGSPQSVILAGLDPAARYYFGIKAVDELENASASAALADAATLAPEAPPLPPPGPIEIVTLPPGGVEPPPPVTMEIDIPVTGPFTGWQNLTLSLNGYIQQTQFVVDDAARNVRLGRLAVTGGSVMTGSVPGVSMAEMAVGQAVVASPAPIGGMLASGLSGMDVGYYAAIDPVNPGKVAGFAAERGENPGEVVLFWNAPGDDAEAPGDGLGVAKAMNYELRHAEAELATFDFNTATPAQAPLPADVGTPQSVTISGLGEGKVLSLGIRALDELNNRGNLATAQVQTYFAARSAELMGGAPAVELLSLSAGIEISAQDTPPYADPLVALAVSQAAAQGFVFYAGPYRITPAGWQFDPPAKARMRYPDPGNPEVESSLAIYHYDAQSGLWTPLANARKNPERNEVLGDVATLSLFAVLAPDEEAPHTTLDLADGRRFVGLAGELFTSASAHLMLSARDPPVGISSGTGVSRTEYRFDNANGAFTPLELGTPLPPSQAGAHTLQYHSYDFAGNTEPVRGASIQVDGAAPAAVLSSSERFYPLSDGVVIASTRTPTGGTPELVVTLADPLVQGGPPGVGSGVAFSSRSLDGGPWTVAGPTFAAPVAAGVHSLAMRAEDNVGNTLDRSTSPYRVVVGDLKAPRTALGSGGVTASTGSIPASGAVFVTRQTPVVLTSQDDLVNALDGIGLGIASQELRVGAGLRSVFQNAAPEFGKAFSSTFTLASDPDGLYVLGYLAEDSFGNRELSKNAAFAVDNTSPTLSSSFNGWSKVDVLGRRILSTSTEVLLSGVDPLTGGVASGLAELRFQIDSGIEQTLATGPAVFHLPEGRHAVTCSAKDRLANTGLGTPQDLLVDVTPPMLSAPEVGAAGSGSSQQLPVILSTTMADARVVVQDLLSGLKMSADAMIPPDTVGWWRFEENAGVVATDSSGNGNDGILMSSYVSFTQAGCRSGGCVRFTPQMGSSIRVEASPDFASGAFSFLAWVEDLGAGNVGVPRILGWDRHIYVEVADDMGGTLQVYTSRIGWRSTGAQLRGRGWVHLGVTHDASMLKIYVDGSLVASFHDLLPAPSGPIFFGSAYNLAENFNGKMDEIKMFRRALSALELQSDFEGTLFGSRPGYSARLSSDGGTTFNEVPEGRLSLSGVDGTAEPQRLSVSSLTLVESAGSTEPRNILEVTAEDLADNAGSLRFGIFADTTPPLVAISSPSGGQEFVATKDAIRVQFTVSDRLDPAPVFAAHLVQLEDRGSPRGARPALVPVTTGQVIAPLDLDDGVWELQVSATDFVGNAATTFGGSFNVIHDALPPRTTLTVGMPQAGGGPGAIGLPEHGLFVTGRTSMTMTSQDDLVDVSDGLGLGIASQELRAGSSLRSVFHNATPESSKEFSSTFTMVSDPDGLYELAYLAEDVIGNRELPRSASFAVDNTSPSLSMAFNGWSKMDVLGRRILSTSTEVLLSGEDRPKGGVAAGLAELRFQIDSGIEQTLLAGSTGFHLPDGRHRVTYSAEDRLGNTGLGAMQDLLVDVTPPLISAPEMGISGSSNPQALPVILSTTTADARVLVQDVLSGLKVNAETSIPPDMTGWWRFDEGSGVTATDSSGNGNHGDLMSSYVSFTQAGCKSGGCLRFTPQVGSSVRVEASPEFSSGAFSFLAWVEDLGAGNMGVPRILGWDRHIYVEVADDMGGTLQVYTDRIGWRSTGAQLRGRGWVHLGVTHDASMLRIYVDGSLVASFYDPLPAPSGPIFFGSAYNLAENFNGKMDEIKMFRRALSALELQSDFEGTFFGSKPGYSARLSSDGGATFADVPAGRLQLSGTDGTVEMQRLLVSSLNLVDSAGAAEPVNILEVKAEDLGDNAATLRFGIFVDTTPPLVAISSPATGQEFVAMKDVIRIQFAVSDRMDPAPVYESWLAQVEDRGSPRGARPALVPVTTGQMIAPLDLDDGVWELRVSATDFVHNTTITSSGKFNVIHDVLPPRTALAIGLPQIGGGPGAIGLPENGVFVTGQTSMTMTSIDDLATEFDALGLGTGLQSLAVDGAPRQFVNPAPMPGRSFASTFTLTGYPDGVHALAIYAEDILHNQESTRAAIVALDNSVPATLLAVSTPSYKSFVSTRTVLSLSADDPVVGGVASGVDYTRHRIGDGEFASSPLAFPLPGSDGVYAVHYHSVDRLGNIEPLRSNVFQLDARPPKTSLVIVGGLQSAGPEPGSFYASPDTRLSFWIEDDLELGIVSGVAFTRIQTDGAPFETFVSSLQFGEGTHRLSYQSQDRVDNLEVLHSTAVLVDATPPDTLFAIGEPVFIATDGARYVAPRTTVSFSAEDRLVADVRSGLKEIQSDTNGAGFVPYTQPLAFPAGPHTVRYRAVDKVGNIEPFDTLELRSDGWPPVSKVEVSGPLYDPGDRPPFVSTATVFAVSSLDSSGTALSGVAFLRYRINGADFISGNPPPAFKLSGSDGVYAVDYQAQDNVTNIEELKGGSWSLDSTPPGLSTGVSKNPVMRPPANEAWFAEDFAIVWTATDAASGLAWTDQPTAVGTEGRDLVFTGRAMDRVGNGGEVAVRVNLDKTPPRVDAGADFEINEGSTAAFVGAVTDNLDSAPVFSWQFWDGGVAPGVLSPNHAVVQDGVFDATLMATDHAGHSSSDTVRITVRNAAPHITTVTDKMIFEGSPVDIVADFTDPGVLDTHSAEVDWGDGITSSATITEGGGTGTASARHVYGDNGDYTARVVISDDGGGISSSTFKVVVINTAPILAALPDQSAEEGSFIQLPSAQFADPGFDNPAGGTGESFAATVDWGDGTTEPVGDIALTKTNGSATASTLGTIQARHAYPDNGTYTVKVAVSDDDGGMSSSTFKVTVANAAPLLAALPDQNANEGAFIQLPPATFTDPGFDSPAGSTSEDFTALIDWGDGTSEPAGDITLAKIGGAEGTATSGTIQARHAYADNGMYTARVTISDDDGGTSSGTFKVSVANIAPVLAALSDRSANEGSYIQLPPAAFTDPGFDGPAGGSSEGFTATVDWGDGTTEPAGDLTLVKANGGEGTPTAGTIQAKHAYADNGNYTARVTISDDDGGTSSSTFTVTVANVAPTLTALPDQSADEGAFIQLPPGVFTDSGFDNPVGSTSEGFTAAIDWGDGTTEPVADIALANANGSEGTLTLGTIQARHAYADNGVYTAKVVVSDDDGGLSSSTFKVTVANMAPVLAALPDQNANEGSFIELPPAAFSDPGFDNHSGNTSENFSAQIDWGDGTVEPAGDITLAKVGGAEGTPTAGMIQARHAYADNGTYAVRVAVSDDDGGVSSSTFRVMVSNVAPTLVALPDLNAGEGAFIQLQPAAFTDPGFDNPAGGTSEGLSATIDWGDGTAEPVGDIALVKVPGSEGNPTSGTIQARHAYADNGAYTAEVTIRDDDGGVSSGTFKVTVSNAMPVLVAVPDQSASEGSSIQLPPVAFADAGFDNPAGGTSESFNVAIDWGDGTTGPAGDISFSKVNGSEGTPTSGSILARHTYADNGTYTARVMVTDDDGGLASSTLKVTVTNAAPMLAALPDQESDEGSFIELPPAAFTDPGFDNPAGNSSENFTAAVDWGDGTTEPVGDISLAKTNGSAGALTAGTIQARHSYADNGTYTAKVTVSDDDGGTSSSTFKVTVANAAPLLAALPDQNANEGAVIQLPPATFTDPGFGSPAGSTSEDFTALIEWGDGTSEPAGDITLAKIGGAEGTATSGTIQARHAYADNGVYTARVTVSDDDGGTSSGTFKVTVANMVPVLAALSDQGANEGSFIQLPPAAFTDPGFDGPAGGSSEGFTATVDWGDGTIEPAGELTLVKANGGEGTPTAGTIQAKHAYADNGNYTARVTISDDDGGTSSSTFTVTVANVPPQLTAMHDQSANEGAFIQLPPGVFTDPGFDNPASSTNEGFSAAIDWGDGTTEPVGDITIVKVGGAEGTPTAGTIQARHAYADNGIYTAKVTVSDDDGGTASSAFKITVANVAPVLAALSNQSANEGAFIQLPPATWSDPGFDNSAGGTSEGFTATVDWGDGTTEPVGDIVLAKVNGGEGALTSGTIQARHAYADNGSYTARVTVSDDDGGVASSAFKITVANVAPVLAALSDQSANEGAFVQLPPATFTDAGFDDPAGSTNEGFSASVDWGDGTTEPVGDITLVKVGGAEGTPTAGTIQARHAYADNGEYVVRVAVTDDDGGSSSSVFKVVVANVAPLVAALPDQHSDEGSFIQLPPAAFTDPGFDNPGSGTSEGFTATVDWGDGTTEPIADITVAKVNGDEGIQTSGTIQARHAYADNGAYTARITVSDDDGGISSSTVRVTVRNVAPDLAALPDQSAAEGSFIQLPPGAFSDPGFDNPAGGTSESVTASIDWGDGTIEPVSDIVLVKVNGSEGTATVGTIQAGHAYADNGAYTPKVTVSDDDGGVSFRTFRVTVTNVAPALAAVADQSTTEGGFIQLPPATFTDPGFDNPAGRTNEGFIAAIDWGDGTSEPAGDITLTKTDGTEGSLSVGTIQARHAYADNGAFIVNVTVRDDDGGTSSTTFKVAVANAAPILAAMPDQSASEGSFIQLPPAAFADPGFDNPAGSTSEGFIAAVDWGDGTVEPAADIALLKVNGAEGVFTAGTIQARHAYADNGSYTVRVTVSDDDAATDIKTFKATIGNVSPVVKVGSDTVAAADGILWIGGGVPARTIEVHVLPDTTTLKSFPVGPSEPQLFPAGSFTDPGFDNPAASTREDFTATIEWGDGSSSSGPDLSLTENPGGEGVPTSGSISNVRHQYAGNGVYAVKLTVTDDDGGTNATQWRVTVDREPPSTSVSYIGQFVLASAAPDGMPQGLDVFLRSDSRITLTAEDPSVNGVSFGVQRIFWRDGTAGPFNLYDGPFNPGQPGLHVVEYFSVDYRGNEEPHKLLAVGVEDTPPLTAWALGEPKTSVFGLDVIASTTPISFTAGDQFGVGVVVGMGRITYRVDGGPLQIYGAPFPVPQQGVHVIEYGAIDRLENAETRRTFRIGVANFQFAAISAVEGLSGSGTAEAAGLLQTNGRAEFSGSVRALGDVTAATVTLSGQALVAGVVTEGAAPLHPDPLDIRLISQLAGAASANALIPAEFLVDGALVVDAGRTLILDTGTYVVEALTVSGQGKLLARGPVHILAHGEVRINGGGELNAAGRSSDLAVFSESTMPVHLSGGAKVVGWLYAPLASLEIAGNALVGGHSFARTARLSGTSNVVASGEVLPSAAPVTGGGKKGKTASTSGPAPAQGAADPAFALRELYVFPNPAVGGAKPVIHAAVGIADKVTFRVFNVAGQQVHEASLEGVPPILDDGSGAKYAYEYAWAGHIPSGLYLYTVVAEKSGEANIRKAGKLAVVR